MALTTSIRLGLSILYLIGCFLITGHLESLGNQNSFFFFIGFILLVNNPFIHLLISKSGKNPFFNHLYFSVFPINRKYLIWEESKYFSFSLSSLLLIICSSFFAYRLMDYGNLEVSFWYFFPIFFIQNLLIMLSTIVVKALLITQKSLKRDYSAIIILFIVLNQCISTLRDYPIGETLNNFYIFSGSQIYLKNASITDLLTFLVSSVPVLLLYVVFNKRYLEWPIT